MWEPEALTPSQQDACMSLLGYLHRQINELDTRSLGDGPEVLACDFMRKQAIDAVAALMRKVAAGG